MDQWAAYCDGATLIAQVIPSKERDERRPTQDDRQQLLHSSTSTMSLGYARLTSGDDSLLPSQIFLCRRHPAPREKWRRWEIGGPQNPLQGFEVLVAQMRQIRL